MNAQKFTQKSLEAIQAAQDLTIENQNMQMEEVHLLIALLEQDQGLIPQLLLKMELPAQDIAARARRVLGSLSKVSGPGREAGKIYISAPMDVMLTEAEKTAEHMKDEFVSVEHLFLSMLEHPDGTGYFQGIPHREKRLFEGAGHRAGQHPGHGGQPGIHL